MTTPNPINNPGAFDLFKLDKLLSPFCRITECNGRELTWQEQQAPGFAGAFVVFRGEKLVSVTYGIEVISNDPGSVASFTKYAPLVAYCNAAKNARPPRGMRLIDQRLADLRIPQVAMARIPWQENPEPGRWIYKIKFQEYRRLQIAGGVAKAKNALETQIDEQEFVNAGLRAQKAAVAQQLAAAKAERAAANKHVPGT